jgi:hypothetical protein
VGVGVSTGVAVGSGVVVAVGSGVSVGVEVDVGVDVLVAVGTGVIVFFWRFKFTNDWDCGLSAKALEKEGVPNQANPATKINTKMNIHGTNTGRL